MSLQDSRWFQIAKRHIDCMLDFGRMDDCPLFAGVINPVSRKPVVALSPPPPGVRIADFNWAGNNFMHDIPLLEVMIALTKLTGDARYDQSVDEMCDFYGAHGAHRDTGLFGWGEHAQWSLPDREILPCSFTHGLVDFRRDGYMAHDHLRCAPGWFWQRMCKFHPDTVVRFAHGLNGHIVDEKTYEHNRHAALTANWWRDPKKPDFDAGKDFARHAGFHIIDCAAAYRHSRDESLLHWARGILNWHLKQRFANGIIRGCVRTPNYEQEGHHDSLALSVDHAADILGRNTPEGREFAGVADEMFDARRKQYAGAVPDHPYVPGDPRLWVWGYYRKRTLPPTITANMLALMHDRAGIQWYADQLIALAHFVRDDLPPAPDTPMIANAFHQFLETLLLAYQITGEASLLEAAQQMAKQAADRLLCEGMLCGTSGYTLWDGGQDRNFEWHCDPWVDPPTSKGYYYSVTGTPLLIRSMLHLALIEQGDADILGIDLHRR